jgi:hypothetical protein
VELDCLGTQTKGRIEFRTLTGLYSKSDLVFELWTSHNTSCLVARHDLPHRIGPVGSHLPRKSPSGRAYLLCLNYTDRHSFNEHLRPCFLTDIVDLTCLHAPVGFPSHLIFKLAGQLLDLRG